MKHVTIQQSLQYVVDHPEMPAENLIALPAHELISRTLFELANGGQLGNKQSLQRANIARTLIFTRLVGRRRPGSHPAVKKNTALQFKDLTGGGGND